MPVSFSIKSSCLKLVFEEKPYPNQESQRVGITCVKTQFFIPLTHCNRSVVLSLHHFLLCQNVAYYRENNNCCTAGGTFVTSLLATKALCVHRVDFLMQMFASPDIATLTQGVCAVSSAKSGILHYPVILKKHTV